MQTLKFGDDADRGSLCSLRQMSRALLKLAPLFRVALKSVRPASSLVRGFTVSALHRASASKVIVNSPQAPPAIGPYRYGAPLHGAPSSCTHLTRVCAPAAKRSRLTASCTSRACSVSMRRSITSPRSISSRGFNTESACGEC
jgi:hypothetical protein